MKLPNRPCRPAPLPWILALGLAFASTARAAEIYVLDALMERDGAESVSPTFIVTPGERALLSFDGERDLDIAMTLTPGSGEAFDLRVELVDGVELHDTTVPVSLAETETLELAGRTFKVLVRVQEPLGGESAPAPAADAATSGGEDAAPGTADGS